MREREVLNKERGVRGIVSLCFCTCVHNKGNERERERGKEERREGGRRERGNFFHFILPQI